jgi:hypothetical protein
MDNAESPVNINYIRLLEFAKANGVTPEIANAVNNMTWAIQHQLPEGAEITRFYTAFEGGIKMIAKLPGSGEMRYNIDFNGGDITVKPNP